MMILGHPIPWLAVLGGALIATAITAVLLARAAVAGARAYRSLTGDQRARARESALLALVWGSAATLSASNVIGYARTTMHLPLPMAVMFFAALDGAAAILLSMLVRRAANSLSSTVIRTVVWTLLGASAITNWMHAPHSFGAHLMSAIMPAIAGALAELWLHEVRADSRRARPRIADRQVPWTAWLNPVDAMSAVRMLQSDPGLPYATAMLAVRVDRAAAALYRLRSAMKAQAGAARHVRLRSNGIRRAESRALAALRRAGFAEDGITRLVLGQLQMRVLVRDFAMLDCSSPAAANAAIAALIKGDAPKAEKEKRAQPPSPPSNDEVPAGARGGKSQVARAYWIKEITAGRDPQTISAAELLKAAGASPTSASGRIWRATFLAESGVTDDGSVSGGRKAASG